MARVCQITGRRTERGNSIARRGLAKPKGGIGLKTTGVTKRTFKANIQVKKIWVGELGCFVRVKLSTKALKTISAKGAYRVLLDAGLIKPARPGRKRNRLVRKDDQASA
ncbi:MAG: large subunit ribosomal protein L28 [Pseudohongiellaceae bacterium]|jgi:large subunit ribosomal protein L28